MVYLSDSIGRKKGTYRRYNDCFESMFHIQSLKGNRLNALFEYFR
jgi:hypothetical protein